VDLSYLQAIVIGVLQGVTELFPVSSLGHAVLVPAWIGGSWHHLVTEDATSASENSPYLAFIVALHVATAIALLCFYWRTWIRIIGAFFTSVRTRSITTSTQRLAWLIVFSTIPCGILGLALEHPLRTLFAKPLAAAIFLTVNAFILFAGERLRRTPASESVGTVPATHAAGGDEAIITTKVSFAQAGVMGVAQTFALLAGISRSGITMVAGLLRGLDHEDAVNFSFLLATPIIFAAGLVKLPTLTHPDATAIRGPVLAGAAVAFVAALLSIKFLTKYFERRSLYPFAAYCLVAGVASIIHFA
jgi:undecaprenyl-diphosphatase